MPTVIVGRLAQGQPTVTLENEHLRAIILPDKGADIWGLEWLPTGIDILWKPPWGSRGASPLLPARDSVEAWMDAYLGGWQILFPSGGAPSEHRGTTLVFHGEASLASWAWHADADDRQAEVVLRTSLVRSPFDLERCVVLEAGRPILSVTDTITNRSPEPIEYLLGQHPAFGSPLVGPAARIATDAQTVVVDDSYDGPDNPLEPGSRHAWPVAAGRHGPVDLSRLPPVGERRTFLVYLTDFAEGWYAISNPDAGLGVAVRWDASFQPYVWFWQELHASSGYPWYRSAYVTALEPNTSFPGQGLGTVIAKTGTHQVLSPGESRQTRVTATLFDADGDVIGLAPDGDVLRLKESR